MLTISHRLLINIVTILILINLFLRWYRKNQKNKSDNNDLDDVFVTASDVINDNTKDPLIVSRAYFTEPLEGPMGDFEGRQTPSDYLWIKGKSIQA